MFRDYVAEVAICSGESMQPTLRDWGDAVLVTKLSLRPLQPNDIIIATSPTDPERVLCKRIVAMEGETVPGAAGVWGQRVPKGSVWVEGDNAARSLDSRHFGPLPLGLVKGKVICKVWPLSQFGSPLPSKPQITTYIKIA